MNRIILIGNGFDLAHELKTSYKDFIEWFWEKSIYSLRENGGYIQENENLTIKFNFYSTPPKEPYKKGNISVSAPEMGDKFHKKIEEIIDNIFSKEITRGDRAEIIKVTINLKNEFLKIISDNFLLQNWAGIESEYYREIKDIIQNKSPYCSEDKNKKAIKKLNADFKEIKRELEKYLQDKRNDKIIENLKEKIYSNFDKEDFTKEGVNGLVEDVYQNHVIDCNFGTKTSYTEQAKFYNDHSFLASYSDDRDYINREIREGKMNLMSLENILFLNFNYTKTESKYNEYEDIETQTIHIHGELNNPNNPIIFGYGDEIGKKYEEIENLNDNDFLENIKSIRYSDTNNYKKLLDYINSDKYQIFLFGHSCGLSDRTLLNTLFEHENCVSIKPFYHKEKDGTDNYSDIVRNISRHFKDKAVMRAKVVNKDYCKPIS